MPRLLAPRGEVSSFLLERLARDPHELPAAPPLEAADPLADEDLQLALYLMYELHYRGLPEVAAEWEWEPSLLRLRREVERLVEGALEGQLGAPAGEPSADEMDIVLGALCSKAGGPSLSSYIEREAELEQVREFMVHRSIYQLKEADPHSWALPRLSGRPKAALVEIQADEYGGGRVERIHAEMFAEAMDAVGLDPTYGAYLDRVPAVTLATVNVLSMFGLHRRWRGALVGHLAVFEMTSSIPNGRYAAGLRRLGFGGRATAFFDEHVEADAVHENIAAVDLAGGLARQEPDLAADVVWGARALLALEDRWSRALLEAWAASRSSLLVPLSPGVAA
ncbi:MAG: iron-containing redox enzyme family protein [Actinomycetota bacterium]|nr:iron-containing redox enzyme family protein [Actinomycetota bacterium]